MPPWWLRALGSAAVVVALLVFVPIRDVWAAVRDVRPWVWIASVGIFLAGHSLNAMKLRALVGSRASRGACLRAHFAGLAANLGLPGVAGGDVVRASYLARAVGGAQVTVAAVTDRLLDLIVLVLISVTAAAVAGLPPAMTQSGWTGRRGVIVIGLTAATMLFARWSWMRWRPPNAREALSRLLAAPGAVALAMAISVIVQSVFVLTNVWLASEVGVRIDLAPWFLAWTGAKLAVVLPISIGGIGVREATLVSVLASYGAPSDRVLAAGILWEGAIVAGSVSGFLATQLRRR